MNKPLTAWYDLCEGSWNKQIEHLELFQQESEQLLQHWLNSQKRIVENNTSVLKENVEQLRQYLEGYKVL